MRKFEPARIMRNSSAVELANNWVATNGLVTWDASCVPRIATARMVIFARRLSSAPDQIVPDAFQSTNVLPIVNKVKLFWWLNLFVFWFLLFYSDAKISRNPRFRGHPNHSRAIIRIRRIDMSYPNRNRILRKALISNKLLFLFKEWEDFYPTTSRELDWTSSRIRISWFIGLSMKLIFGFVCKCKSIGHRACSLTAFQ